MITEAQREQRRAAGRARMAKMRDSGELNTFQRAAREVWNETNSMANLYRSAATYRIANQSAPMKRAMAIIANLGIPADAVDIEFAPLGWEVGYTLDIAFYASRGVKIALEIDGGVHRVFGSIERTAFETARDATLANAGWQIVRIDDRDLDTDYTLALIIGAWQAARQEMELVA